MKNKSNRNRNHRRRNRLTRRMKRNNARRTKNNRKYFQMKGGLGPHDGVNIGITDRMSFKYPERNLANFKEYIFGSNERAEQWISLLTLCHTKRVPVYIITNGNKIGIVRTLQLLEMDHLIKEVLCIRKDRRVNPRNTTGLHDFGTEEDRYATKFEVIAQIMSENDRSCEYSDGSPHQCIFVDDDDVYRSSARRELCLNVEILNAKQSIESKNSCENKAILKTFNNNYFSILFDNICMFTRDQYKSINIIPQECIDRITARVTGETCNILFLDCDGTLFIQPGALSLHNPGIHDRINKYLIINKYLDHDLLQITS
jgi:hypothetical protein